MKRVSSITTTNRAGVDFPPVRTREHARTIAKKIRSSGMSPTTPIKTKFGWQVMATQAGGTLSISRKPSGRFK